jgi:hypothetical protein
MSPSMVRRASKPDEKGIKLLETAIDRLGLSARA